MHHYVFTTKICYNNWLSYPGNLPGLPIFLVELLFLLNAGFFAVGSDGEFSRLSCLVAPSSIVHLWRMIDHGIDSKRLSKYWYDQASHHCPRGHHIFYMCHFLAWHHVAGWSSSKFDCLRRRHCRYPRKGHPLGLINIIFTRVISKQLNTDKKMWRQYERWGQGLAVMDCTKLCRKNWKL